MGFNHHAVCVLVALCVAPVLGCQPSTKAGPQLEACTRDDVPSRSLCTKVEVPENPEDPSGRVIELEVVVVRAISADKLPDPVFFFAGGPGQAATGVAEDVSRVLRASRLRRDLVFVDQRGTGDSNPMDCDLTGTTQTSDGFLGLPDETLLACLEDLDAAPEHYGTHRAVDDFDHVREVLGYEQINIVGGSYGTRSALTYARRHPDRVRTLTLDGVAPPDVPIPLHFPDDNQAALDAVFADCFRNPVCEEVFRGLPERLPDLVSGSGTVEFTDPLTGEPTTMELSRTAVTGAVRSLLYSPLAAANLPLALLAAEEGDWGPLTASLYQLQDRGDMSLSLGLTLSILCGEDIPRITEEDIERVATPVFGPEPIRGMQGTCEKWPAVDPAPDHAEPVSTDVAVLLLSGSGDPVTPPRWAEHAAKTLPNSKHFVASGMGHGVMTLGCSSRLIAQFIEDGTAANVDGECLQELSRPAAFVSRMGPAK
jgi:pimeloyl-ACP methyl ester carboxylesterase